MMKNWEIKHDIIQWSCIIIHLTERYCVATTADNTQWISQFNLLIIHSEKWKTNHLLFIYKICTWHIASFPLINVFTPTPIISILRHPTWQFAPWSWTEWEPEHKHASSQIKLLKNFSIQCFPTHPTSSEWRKNAWMRMSRHFSLTWRMEQNGIICIWEKCWFWRWFSLMLEKKEGIIMNYLTCSETVQIRWAKGAKKYEIWDIYIFSVYKVW